MKGASLLIFPSLEDPDRIRTKKGPDSIHQTAETYYHGNGVEQSYAKAAELFRKAADLGHERSQFSIGHMYQRGEGVERSEEESRRWFDMWQS